MARGGDVCGCREEAEGLERSEHRQRQSAGLAKVLRDCVKKVWGWEHSGKASALWLELSSSLLRPLCVCPGHHLSLPLEALPFP